MILQNQQIFISIDTQLIQWETSLYTSIKPLLFQRPWPCRMRQQSQKPWEMVPQTSPLRVTNSNLVPATFHPSPLNATDLTLPSSFLSSFRLTDQKRLVDSIEDKVWIRSRSTRIEFTSRGEKSDKSYSNNSKVVWIAADPWRELSSPLLLLREDRGAGRF